MRTEGRTYRLIGKTLVASVGVIGTNVMGNYALKRGLTHADVGSTWSPLPYIQAFSHPWVDIGVAFMLAWLITRLALLSWADLSYVLPVTAFSYVLTAVVGAMVLGEHVSPVHWIATCLITLGVAVTVFTVPDTTTHHPGQLAAIRTNDGCTE